MLQIAEAGTQTLREMRQQSSTEDWEVHQVSFGDGITLYSIGDGLDYTTYVFQGNVPKYFVNHGFSEGVVLSNENILRQANLR